MITRAAVLRQMNTTAPYADSRPLEIVELELADPGAGEVLIRVDAAGLCHSDLSVIDGSRPRPLPMVLGHEAAGTVMEVGPGVTELKPGDHVVATFVPSCGNCETCTSGRPVLCPSAQAANREAVLATGTRPFSDEAGPLNHHLGVSAFSDYTVVSPRSLVKIPNDLPFETAAVFGCALLTGVGAVLNTASVRPGDSVAIFGLGGVGLAALLGAQLAGAAKIVAVDIVTNKLKLASTLGATDVVDASSGNAVETVRDVTSGGADWCFETAGSAKVLTDCYRASASGGTTVAVGLPHPDHEFSIPAVSLVADEKTVKGSYMGSAVPKRDIPRLVSLYQAGRLPVEKLISRRHLDLTDLNQALDALAAGTEVRQIVEHR